MSLHRRQLRTVETRVDVNLSDVSIVYVEDDATAHGILCPFINAKYPAIPIYSAGSAAEGLQLFRKHRQSIIITDINLAESDGIQMVRSIRMLDPDTVIRLCGGVHRFAAQAIPRIYAARAEKNPFRTKTKEAIS